MPQSGKLHYGVSRNFTCANGASFTILEEERNTKCEKCGSTNIIEGNLSTGTGGLVFTTKASQTKLPFTKNYTTITAKGCKDCGAIFDIRMENPQAIIDNK